MHSRCAQCVVYMDWHYRYVISVKIIHSWSYMELMHRILCALVISTHLYNDVEHQPASHILHNTHYPALLRCTEFLCTLHFLTLPASHASQYAFDTCSVDKEDDK